MLRLSVLALAVSFCSTAIYAQPEFIRGDVDIDGVVDMGDVLLLLAQGKSQAPLPECPAATDVDNNGDLNDACPICQDAFCGDGFRYFGQEECDDGNQNDNDGCTTQCIANYLEYTFTM